MKQYTPAIVNEIKKKSIFSFSRKYETRYYEGVHRQDETVRALWIEMNALGKPLCYPCVLWEGEKLMAFRSGMTRENKVMMQRWTEVISPESFPSRNWRKETFPPSIRRPRTRWISWKG